MRRPLGKTRETLSPKSEAAYPKPCVTCKMRNKAKQNKTLKEAKLQRPAELLGWRRAIYLRAALFTQMEHKKKPFYVFCIIYLCIMLSSWSTAAQQGVGCNYAAQEFTQRVHLQILWVYLMSFWSVEKLPFACCGNTLLQYKHVATYNIFRRDKKATWWKYFCCAQRFFWGVYFCSHHHMSFFF